MGTQQDGLRLDLGISELFPNLNGSMALWFHSSLSWGVGAIFPDASLSFYSFLFNHSRLRIGRLSCGGFFLF